MKVLKSNLLSIAVFISVVTSILVGMHQYNGDTRPEIATLDSRIVPNPLMKIKVPEITAPTLIKTVKLNKRKDFLFHMGFFESGNDYTKVNTIGYLGKYQFGKSTLNTLKYKGTIIAFLNNGHIQENIMFKNLKYNKRQLSTIINEYSGVVINNVTITESGILAAAHLAGAGNVRGFFRHGKKSKDIYGSSVTKYLCEFSGYNLKL